MGYEVRVEKVDKGRPLAVVRRRAMAGPFAGVGEVVASALPVGMVVSTVHLGPYQKLGEAHGAIKAWCARNGHELAGPKWEIYGHWLEEWNKDPSKIRTDVFYLLRGA
jgi:effector-binding domain-containing protein